MCCVGGGTTDAAAAAADIPVTAVVAWMDAFAVTARPPERSVLHSSIHSDRLPEHLDGPSGCAGQETVFSCH